jgi:hypothetical protein
MSGEGKEGGRGGEGKETGKGAGKTRDPEGVRPWGNIVCQ